MDNSTDQWLEEPSSQRVKTFIAQQNRHYEQAMGEIQDLQQQRAAEMITRLDMSRQTPAYRQGGLVCTSKICSRAVSPA